MQYVFPIRGIYTFDLEITSVPEGAAFPSTSLQTVRISENPVVARNAWLLIGGLLIFGGIIGAIFARSAAAREKLLLRHRWPTLLYCGALGSVSTVAAHGGHTEGTSYRAPERQVIRGDDGWELEIHPARCQL